MEDSVRKRDIWLSGPLCHNGRENNCQNPNFHRKELLDSEENPSPRLHPKKICWGAETQWCEQRTDSSRRRTHNYSLCGRADHKARYYPLCKVFYVDENTRDCH